MPAPFDIGVSTSAYSELLLGPALERIAALGVASAEVRSFGMHTLLSRSSRAAADASALSLSVHGPFGYKGLGDLDDAARRADLEVHRRHLTAAAEIGATLYLVHPDWHPMPRPHDAAVLEALRRSYEQLRLMQDETGVPIVVENMPGVGCSHLTAPGDLRPHGPLDLCGLGFALDAGHASISGTLQDFLAAPPPGWRHVHLHSNGGEGDLDDPHLPVGAGVVDAAAVLAAARAAGASVVLEMTDDAGVVASLEHLRARGLIG